MCCHVSPARNACCGSTGAPAKRMAKRWFRPCTSCKKTRSGLSVCKPSRRSWITMRRLKCDRPLWMLRVRTRRRSIFIFTEHHDRIAVRPGEAFCRRRAPRQPLVGEVLLRRDTYGHARRQLEPKYMLDVLQYARRKAAAPLLVYLKRINDIPARQPSVCRIDAGFLQQFALRRTLE